MSQPTRATPSRNSARRLTSAAYRTRICSGRSRSTFLATFLCSYTSEGIRSSAESSPYRNMEPGGPKCTSVVQPASRTTWLGSHKRLDRTSWARARVDIRDRRQRPGRRGHPRSAPSHHGRKPAGARPTHRSARLVRAAGRIRSTGHLRATRDAAHSATPVRRGHSRGGGVGCLCSNRRALRRACAREGSRRGRDLDARRPDAVCRNHRESSPRRCRGPATLGRESGAPPYRAARLRSRRRTRRRPAGGVHQERVARARRRMLALDARASRWAHVPGHAHTAPADTKQRAAGSRRGLTSAREGGLWGLRKRARTPSPRRSSELTATQRFGDAASDRSGHSPSNVGDPWSARQRCCFCCVSLDCPQSLILRLLHQRRPPPQCGERLAAIRIPSGFRCASQRRWAASTPTAADRTTGIGRLIFLIRKGSETTQSTPPVPAKHGSCPQRPEGAEVRELQRT
ncbi:hypothetical protein C8N24_0267 [Solirubrobacter pauli]|uniref:Uncharacterized protein n=1 Tax=Solirubrobacter pauli TaxID=166793 RepID=A0A660LBR3_9ACTN|nr:hypothetical protein C8N24_0267 [Solirubrobacter pauli]